MSNIHISCFGPGLAEPMGDIYIHASPSKDALRIGRVCVRVQGNDAIIHSLEVDSAGRMAGVGEELLKKALEVCGEKVTHLWCRRKHLAYYKSFGFVESTKPTRLGVWYPTSVYPYWLTKEK